jgi:hypothetical protein
LNGLVGICFYLNVLPIQHKNNGVFAWYVKINSVALYVKTVGALHIEKGPLFLRKQFQANSLSVQMH